MITAEEMIEALIIYANLGISIEEIKWVENQFVLI